MILAQAYFLICDFLGATAPILINRGAHALIILYLKASAGILNNLKRSLLIRQFIVIAYEKVQFWQVFSQFILEIPQF